MVQVLRIALMLLLSSQLYSQNIFVQGYVVDSTGVNVFVDVQYNITLDSSYIYLPQGRFKIKKSVITGKSLHLILDNNQVVSYREDPLMGQMFAVVSPQGRWVMWTKKVKAFKVEFDPISEK